VSRTKMTEEKYVEAHCKLGVNFQYIKTEVKHVYKQFL